MIELLDPCLFLSVIDPITMGALIMAGSSLVGSGIGLFGSSKQNSNNQQYNRDMMELQQQYNERNMKSQYLYDRQLTLETPSLNVEGMRNAGLNPALINGQPSAQTSSASGGMPSSNYSPFDIMNGASLGQSIGNSAMLLGEQLKNLQADTKLKLSNSNKADAEIERINTLLQPELDNLVETALNARYDRTSLKPQQLANMQVEEKQLKKQLEEIQSRIDLNVASTKLSNKQRELLVSQIKKTYAEIGKIHQEVAESKSRVSVNDASIGLMHAQKYATSQQGYTEQYNRANIRLQNALNRFELRCRESLGVGYYANKQVILDVVSGLKDAALTVGAAGVASKSFKSAPAAPAGGYVQRGFTTNMSQ